MAFGVPYQPGLYAELLSNGAADAVGHARSAYTAPASGISAAATGTAKLAYYLGAR